MNPLIQLKKATPLFVIALVLACFVLSPQAFGQSTTPTFRPANWSGCQHSINVKISTTLSGANVRIEAIVGQVHMDIATQLDQLTGLHVGVAPVGRLGTLTVCARAYRGVVKTAWGYSTYTCNCPGNQSYCLH